MPLTVARYRPRCLKVSDYYRCTEDYFETFVQNYDEPFSRQYGFWRPYLRQVIYVCPSGYRYLDCGALRNGFARVPVSNIDCKWLILT